MSVQITRAARRAAWMAHNRAPNTAPVAQAAGRAGRLDIGALVLRGFDRRTGARVAAAFERHLAELTRAGVVPQGWLGGAGELRGHKMRVASLNDPAAIGERLALAVFEARAAGGRR